MPSPGRDAFSADTVPPLGPPTRGAPTPDDIADELADHLASRTEELQARGKAAETAAAQALREFGDVNQVRRRLYWVHFGDQIMSQRWLFAAMGALVLAMAGLGWHQYRTAVLATTAIQEMSARLLTSLQNEGEAIIRVQDDEGKPLPGVTLDIAAAGPSPQLGNAVYSTKQTSDAQGVVHTGRVPRGSYVASFQLPGKPPEGVLWELKATCRFDIFSIERMTDATMVIPRLHDWHVTLQMPESVDTPRDAARLQGKWKTGASEVSILVSAPTDRVATIALPYGARARAHVTTASGSYTALLVTPETATIDSLSVMMEPANRANSDSPAPATDSAQPSPTSQSITDLQREVAALRNEGRAIIRVVDSRQHPVVGAKLTVRGANPSPQLSNATYRGEFVSDENGLVQTGSLVLGEYRVSYWQKYPGVTDDSDGSLTVEGDFSIFSVDRTVDVTFLIPTFRNTELTVLPPKLPEGWTIRGDSAIIRFKWATRGKRSVGASVSVPLSKRVRIGVPELAESATATVDAELRPPPGPQSQSLRDLRVGPMSISALLNQSNPTIQFEADKHFWKRMGVANP